MKTQYAVALAIAPRLRLVLPRFKVCHAQAKPPGLFYH